MSRRKSFKKSLRESFRRLRGRRSSARTRRQGADSPSKTEERAAARCVCVITVYRLYGLVYNIMYCIIYVKPGLESKAESTI